MDVTEDAAVPWLCPGCALAVAAGGRWNPAGEKHRLHLQWRNRDMINPTTQITENTSRISCFLGLLFLSASEDISASPEESLEASNITGGSTDECNLIF